MKVMQRSGEPILQRAAAAAAPGTIADATWRDLDLGRVFASIDSCASLPGALSLYGWLRTPILRAGDLPTLRARMLAAAPVRSQPGKWAALQTARATSPLAPRQAASGERFQDDVIHAHEVRVTVGAQVGSDDNQRRIAASRGPLEADERSPSAQPSDSEEAITEPSLVSLEAARIAQRFGLFERYGRSQEIAVTVESPWKLNALGVVLIVALVCSMTGLVMLWIKSDHARSTPAASDNGQDAIAVQPAPSPAEVAPAAPVVAAVPPAVAAPATPAVPLAATPEEVAGPPKREQLLLLLTVGTEHYARKQLREMKTKCAAPLAIYRQRRGRCAWARCFAIALPAADKDLAEACGHASGQSLRDRDDFIGP